MQISDQSIEFSATTGQAAYGKATITGLPMHGSYQLTALGKLWSGPRRRFKEKHGIGVIVTFIPSVTDPGTFRCTFTVNTASMGKAQTEKTSQVFASTFDEQVALLEDTLQKFEDHDKYGLMAYNDLVALGAGEREFTRLLNNFLKDVGIRNEADEQRSREEAQAKVVAAKINRESTDVTLWRMFEQIVHEQPPSDGYGLLTDPGPAAVQAI